MLLRPTQRFTPTTTGLPGGAIHHYKRLILSSSLILSYLSDDNVRCLSTLRSPMDHHYQRYSTTKALSSSFSSSSTSPTVNSGPSSSFSVPAVILPSMTSKLQAARMERGGLHQEYFMFIETAYIPHYAVHVTYTNDVHSVNRWIKQHIPLVSIPSVPTTTMNVRYIGLDCEWRANTRVGDENRVAVVQLATEKAVLVFQTSCSIVPESALLSTASLQYALANDTLVLNANPHDLPIPIEFARIMLDPTVMFVGVGVKNDYQKCIKDFKMDTLNMGILLQRLQLPLWVLQQGNLPSSSSLLSSPSSLSSTATHNPDSFFTVPIFDRSFAEKRVTEMSEKYFSEKRLKALEGGGIGLKSIGTTVLGISGWAAKGEKAHIHRQWELPLSLSQLRYAALDAWVSKVAYEVIETHGRRLPREEELARRHSKKLGLTIIPRIIDFSILRALQHNIEANADCLPSTLPKISGSMDMSIEEYLPYYSSMYLKSAVAAPVTAFDREYSHRFATTVSSNTTVPSLPPVDHHNKLLYMKARNLLINALREGYSILSLPGRIATAACSLREDFALAMRDPSIIHIVENTLHWFTKGTLSSPPVGGAGHLRARRPFPTHRRLRRLGRPVPESRFEPDCHSYLQLSRSPEDKETTIILRTKKQLKLKQIKQEHKMERWQKIHLVSSAVDSTSTGIVLNDDEGNEEIEYDYNNNSTYIDRNTLSEPPQLPLSEKDDSLSSPSSSFPSLDTTASVRSSSLSINDSTTQHNNRLDSIVLSYSNWPMSGLLHAARIASRKAAFLLPSSSSSVTESKSLYSTLIDTTVLPTTLSTVTIFPPVVPFTYVKTIPVASSSLSSSPTVPLTTLQFQVPNTPHVRLISLPTEYFHWSSTVAILTAEILYYQALASTVDYSKGGKVVVPVEDRTIESTVISLASFSSSLISLRTSRTRPPIPFQTSKSSTKHNPSSPSNPVPESFPILPPNKRSTLDYLVDPWL